MKKLFHAIYVVLAFLCVGIGCIGIAMPILPTTPFFLLALFLFARGSKRFHRWFLSTRLYKKYLENFVETKSMTKAAKRKVLSIVTLLLGIGFWFSPIYAKIIIGIVAAFHYVYVIFGIKTIRENKWKEECHDKETAYQSDG